MKVGRQAADNGKRDVATRRVKAGFVRFACWSPKLAESGAEADGTETHQVDMSEQVESCCSVVHGWMTGSLDWAEHARKSCQTYHMAFPTHELYHVPVALELRHDLLY